MDKKTENGSEALEPQITSEPQPAESKEKIKISKKTVVIAAIIVFVALIGTLAFVFKGLFIAATVNGSPISRLAVISELEKASGSDALEALITQKLIKQEASKNGISVSEEEVDAEIEVVKKRVEAQGLTFEQALTLQGITEDYLREQIIIQKKLEKLLGDGIEVTEEEIDQYISDYEITIPEGQEAEYRDGIREELWQGKLNSAATELVSSLGEQAKINYFVNY